MFGFDDDGWRIFCGGWFSVVVVVVVVVVVEVRYMELIVSFEVMRRRVFVIMFNIYIWYVRNNI